MLPDWGDDPGKSGWITLRCVEPMPVIGVDEPREIGCGWRGRTRAVTQYGATDWETDRCPVCGGEIKAVE